jgi:hypothetical protein
MVDSVMIDTAHDGEVFNVVVADVPERKTDVVTGTYEVELPAGSSAPVAVRSPICWAKRSRFFCRGRRQVGVRAWVAGGAPRVPTTYACPW